MSIKLGATADNWTAKVTNPNGQVSNVVAFSVQTSATSPVLSVSPTNAVVSAASGVNSLNVSNAGTGTFTYSATVTAGSSWLSITSGATGGNSGVISVAYSANPGAQRSGTIQVAAAGASGSPATVTITQNSNSFTQPLGVDVSQWNGTVDWTKVRNEGGKTFAYIRATAGKNTTDANFNTVGGQRNIVAAHDAGLVVGAYHFAYPQYFTAHDKAQKFLSVAGSYIGFGYLPPVLDIEDSEDDSSFPYRMGSAALSQWIRDWCAEVEQATGVPGRKVILYTTRWYIASYFQSDLNAHPLWVATYPTDPQTDPGSLLPWSTWQFQQSRTNPTTQHTTNDQGGRCPGITGGTGYADLDSFNGDLIAMTNIQGGQIGSTINSVSFTPSTGSLGSFGQTLPVQATVNYSFTTAGYLQVWLYDSGFATSQKFGQYIPAAQAGNAAISGFNLTNNSVGPHDYTAYAQFRPGATTGPLSTDNVSDVYNSSTYTVNWQTTTTQSFAVGSRVRANGNIYVRSVPPALVRLGSSAYTYDQYNGAYG